MLTPTLATPRLVHVQSLEPLAYSFIVSRLRFESLITLLLEPRDHCTMIDDSHQTISAGSSNAPTVLQHRLGTARPLRIITIGAGASGLNMARQIDQHMQHVTHVIYEKNTDVGGTWFENRYPGCACDIPSHNYQFTWEPNPHWNHLQVFPYLASRPTRLTQFLHSYSPAAEILEYFRHVANKYELYRFIKLQHRVVSAIWHEQESRWNLRIENLESGDVLDDWCDFMISGSGILK